MCLAFVFLRADRCKLSDGVSLASYLGGIWPPNGELKLWALLGRCPGGQPLTVVPMWRRHPDVLASYLGPPRGSAPPPQGCAGKAPSRAQPPRVVCSHPGGAAVWFSLSRPHGAHGQGPHGLPCPGTGSWALPLLRSPSQSHQLLRALLPASWAQRDRRACSRWLPCPAASPVTRRAGEGSLVLRVGSASVAFPGVVSRCLPLASQHGRLCVFPSAGRSGSVRR